MSDNTARALAGLACVVALVAVLLAASVANQPVELATQDLVFTGGLTVSAGVGTPVIKVIGQPSGTGTPGAPIQVVNSSGTVIANISQAGAVTGASFATP